MEKKRWVLILMALCLSLAFSVSSVEAQKEQCKNGVDDDGDKLVDCDDPDCESKGFCKGEDPEPAGTILICHFSPNGRHCKGEGGLPRTIQNTLKAIAQHNLHGDCGEDHIVGPLDPLFCAGHCICDPKPDVGLGTIE